MEAPDRTSPLKRLMGETWDRSAEAYDTYHGHGIHSQEERRAWTELLRTNLTAASGQVLEVGCGTGEISFLLAELGHQVTGLDLSPLMIERARRKSADAGLGPDFRTGDAESLSFDDGAFDVVISRHLVWTLPHPAEAVTEWARVTRPGGRVIIIDALWRNQAFAPRIKRVCGEFMHRLIERKPVKGYDPALRAALPHADGLNPDQAADYLAKAGLKTNPPVDLSYLSDIQKRYMPLYHRLAYGIRYFLAWGDRPVSGDGL